MINVGTKDKLAQAIALGFPTYPCKHFFRCQETISTAAGTFYDDGTEQMAIDTTAGIIANGYSTTTIANSVNAGAIYTPKDGDDLLIIKHGKGTGSDDLVLNDSGTASRGVKFGDTGGGGYYFGVPNAANNTYVTAPGTSPASSATTGFTAILWRRAKGEVRIWAAADAANGITSDDMFASHDGVSDYSWSAAPDEFGKSTNSVDISACGGLALFAFGNSSLTNVSDETVIEWLDFMAKAWISNINRITPPGLGYIY